MPQSQRAAAELACSLDRHDGERRADRVSASIEANMARPWRRAEELGQAVRNLDASAVPKSSSRVFRIRWLSARM
jgi:hypothetical protein